MEIISYLNNKSCKRFSYKNQQTKKYINARIKEGYILDEILKKVIDIKCLKWLNSSMEDYLRPQTLFSNKFEGYINETLKQKDTVDKANETINKAKQFDWDFDSQYIQNKCRTYDAYENEKRIEKFQYQCSNE